MTDTGLFVADVWESPRISERFYEAQLGAALQQAGVPETQPQIVPVHNHLHGSGDDAAVIVIVELDGMTTGDYDALTARHADDACRRRRRPPRPSRTSWRSPTTGLVAVDVWGSEEEFAKFGQDRARAAGRRQDGRHEAAVRDGAQPRAPSRRRRRTEIRLTVK